MLAPGLQCFRPMLMRLLFSLIFGLLPSLGFAQDPVLWQWQQSNCQTCAFTIVTKDEALETEKVQRFLRALENSKFEIIQLYNSDPQEYNLLAHMAIGILGRESQFFDSWRYFAKENAQWMVSLIKISRAMLSDDDIDVPANSRGPTQIKDVPDLIEKHYGIVPDTLYIPENAARATMGFLIEALRELKQRAANNNWEFVTKDTYVDYLPYIYFGSSGKLRNRTATPEKNLYVQTMKRYMTWVDLYEYNAQTLKP